MKKLINGNEVSSRTYYYLLEFNDKDNWKFMVTNFNKMKLHELNLDEYRQLFEYATKNDYDNL